MSKYHTTAFEYRQRLSSRATEDKGQVNRDCEIRSNNDEAQRCGGPGAKSDSLTKSSDGSEWSKNGHKRDVSHGPEPVAVGPCCRNTHSSQPTNSVQLPLAQRAVADWLERRFISTLLGIILFESGNAPIWGAV